MKVVNQKVNHTNPGKKESYHGAKLGASKGSDNTDINQFEGKDVRVKPSETTGPDTGNNTHSQTHRAAGASPLRLRGENPKVTFGTHVTNATEE
jgi:hypothetical protein